MSMGWTKGPEGPRDGHLAEPPAQLPPLCCARPHHTTTAHKSPGLPEEEEEMEASPDSAQPQPQQKGQSLAAPFLARVGLAPHHMWG